MAAWEQAMAEHTAATGYVRKNNPPKPRPLPTRQSAASTSPTPTRGR